MIAMSDLAEMANAAESADDSCMDKDTLEERPCSKEEMDAKRAESEQEAAMMQAMLGGLDMSDPETAAEFAVTLERQAGWNRVEYLGDGLFDVEFAIASSLNHDFDFPTFEGFPMQNSFVRANLRDGDRVRIEAPGFSAQGANPFAATMGGLAGAFAYSPEAAAAAGPDSGMPELPQMQGTFRIVTDAAILTNNTDEGPASHTGVQELVWTIAPTTATAPSALLELQR
ncbi:MAG: hypothetical protein JJ992_29355 [Planctomycetes bacterium]|nr:hypothetical protein [Planctomycetota bacterium]